MGGAVREMRGECEFRKIRGREVGKVRDIRVEKVEKEGEFAKNKGRENRGNEGSFEI